MSFKLRKKTAPTYEVKLYIGSKQEHKNKEFDEETIVKTIQNFQNSFRHF